MDALIIRGILVPFRVAIAIAGGVIGGTIGGIIGSGQGITIGWRMWR